MKIKIFPAVSVLSLIFNALFVLLLILSSSSKKAFISFNREDGYVTAAAVAGVPASGEIAFGVIEITLEPLDKAYLQYSFCTDGIKQANMAIASLYDPGIIAVNNTGYGIEITALAGGSTLMQTLTNSGIKDVALITVK